MNPLTGDASTRRYYRLFFPNSERPDETFVVMQLESPQPGTETDYGKLTRFLSSIGIPVPNLFAYDDIKGILLIEDCGDLLLQEAVKACRSERSIRCWYEKSIDLIVRMQKRATVTMESNCPAHHLKFDVEKFMWEFDFMLTHYIQGLLGQNLTAAEKEEIRNQFKTVCVILAEEETWFVHRDYHSRNLMIKDGELKVLDFQDARMGPRQYDLASLLRDSYTELPEELIDALIDYYIDLMNDNGERFDRKRFRYIFDLVALQRNLKAIGTFSFQKICRGNNRYVEDITRTLSHINKTLSRLPGFSDLRRVLARRIPGIEPE